MITIYHNPKCRKSREGLALIEASGKEFEVVKYLDNPLTEKELQELIALLGIAPKALVRTTEAIWKENYKNVPMTDGEIIKALAEHPKLMERPVVVCKDKAAIGRPGSNITDLLKSC